MTTERLKAEIDDCDFRLSCARGRIQELEAALRQIAWMADAAEPISVRAGQIAREALKERSAPPA